jgi:hypothetical protein
VAFVLGHYYSCCGNEVDEGSESIENNLDSDYQIWIRRYTECDKYVRIEPQTISLVGAVSKTEVAMTRKIQASLYYNIMVSSIWRSELAPKA